MMGFTVAPPVMEAQESGVSRSLASAAETPEPESGDATAFVGPQQGASPPRRKVFLYDTERLDISLGVFPQFTGTRTVEQTTNGNFGQTIINETTQGTTPSAGVLGTFHQQLTPWIGYDVNLGYTRLAENYFSSNGSSGTGTSIGTNTYETTVGLVAKGPVSYHRMQTFIQGGGGVLSFLPDRKEAPVSVQFRPTVLFGAGLDLRLSNHFGLRMEYRGLFYKNPDFRNPNIVQTKLFTVTNEPTVSLIYRFGAHRHGMQ